MPRRRNRQVLSKEVIMDYGPFVKNLSHPVVGGVCVNNVEFTHTHADCAISGKKNAKIKICKFDPTHIIAICDSEDLKIRNNMCNYKATGREIHIVAKDGRTISKFRNMTLETNVNLVQKEGVAPCLFCAHKKSRFYRMEKIMVAHPVETSWQKGKKKKKKKKKTNDKYTLGRNPNLGRKKDTDVKVAAFDPCYSVICWCGATCKRAHSPEQKLFTKSYFVSFNALVACQKNTKKKNIDVDEIDTVLTSLENLEALDSAAYSCVSRCAKRLKEYKCNRAAKTASEFMSIMDPFIKSIAAFTRKAEYRDGKITVSGKLVLDLQVKCSELSGNLADFLPEGITVKDDGTTDDGTTDDGTTDDGTETVTSNDSHSHDSNDATVYGKVAPVALGWNAWGISNSSSSPPPGFGTKSSISSPASISTTSPNNNAFTTTAAAWGNKGYLPIADYSATAGYSLVENKLVEELQAENQQLRERVEALEKEARVFRDLYLATCS